ncbi:MAG: BON domain-containing protein [Nitrospiraceae bacterium]
MYRYMSAVLMMMALTGLQGCQSTTGKTAGQTINDASVTTAVQGKLTADRLSNFARVDVDTERGVVNLSGTVTSAEQKARATELARQVNGVVRVNNNLQIQDQTMGQTR